MRIQLQLTKALARSATIAFGFCTLAILWFILQRGVSAHFPALWPQLVVGLSGTLSAASLALVFALPVSIAAAAGLSELRSSALKGVSMTLLHGWASLPSIVVGLCGIALAMAIQKLVPEFRPCLLLAALCLAILILPFLICSFERACCEVRTSLRPQCQALGISWWTGFWRFGLPIFLARANSTVALAFARACEDTAVVMLTGAAFGVGTLRGLLLPFETSSFQIFYLISEAQTPDEIQQMFATVLALVVTVFLLVSVSRLAVGRRSGQW